MKAMQNRILILLTAFFALLSVSSCEKKFEENYPSIFRTDAQGDKVALMTTSYNVQSDNGSLPILVTYSGSWTISFTEPCTWAYLDRPEGRGVKYFHVGYLRNDSGEARTVTVKLVCDNGETLEIAINQAS